VYYALELFLYRKEWKEGGFKKDVLTAKEERRLRKEIKRKRKVIEGDRAEATPPASVEREAPEETLEGKGPSETEAGEPSPSGNEDDGRP
jgi:hypothetical protein